MNDDAVLKPGCHRLLALHSISRAYSQDTTRVLPFFLLAVTLRECLRTGSGFAFPAIAFVAKHLLIASPEYSFVGSFWHILVALGSASFPPLLGPVGTSFCAADRPARRNGHVLGVTL